VAMEQVSLWVLRMSPANIIPPMLHTHLRLHIALTKRKNRRNLGTLKKQCTFGNRK